MTRYDPAAYGDRLGAAYDSLYPPEALDTADAVALLAELASSRPQRSILELGIGTGRLAIALHRQGLSVAGVEASVRMVEALREKAPDADIEVAIGDYASTGVDRTFAVVALVFNNILDPRGTDAQMQIFANAARHLASGGCFVVEAFVLDDAARDGSWNVTPRYVGEDFAELQLARFDIETGTLERTLIHLGKAGSDFVTVRDKYASPAELDVIAHVSGFRRLARYSSWARDPFTARSRRHVTIYERG